MGSTTLGTPATDVDFHSFVWGMNSFESRLDKPLHSKTENSVVCVLSAQLLLGLLYAGAGGQTAYELESLFGVNNNQLQTLGHFKQLGSHLEVPEVKIANTIYVDDGIDLKKGFVEKGQRFFNTTVNHVDFKQKDKAVTAINSWVEEKTGQLIKGFLKKDELDDNAKMVLLNAIYLKAKWEYPFFSVSTKEGDFRVNKSKTIKVQYMTKSSTSNFMYASDKEYQYVIMPYKDSKLSMLIIFPKDHDTFEKNGFPKSKLDSLKFGKFYLDVKIPKFKVESTIDWKKILQSNIPSAFSLSANLSGISNTPLLVSNMIQKAVIKVNEEGTEAAAVSGAEFAPLILPVRFTVDRPFYYAIQMEVASERTFLFQGAVTEPSV